jgi:hypothetical protein
MIEYLDAREVESDVFPDSRRKLWRYRVLRSVLCLIFGAMLALIPHVDGKEAQSENVGLVLKLKGEWSLDGKTIVAGDKLPAGGKIYHAPLKPDQLSSPDYISVVFFDGKIESHSWDNTESRRKPIQLPSARKEAPSRWTRIVNAVMGVFPGHPERYTQMSVRGPTMNPQDAVVDFDNGRLSLRSSLKKLKKGQYLVVLKPISRTDTPDGEGTSNPILLDWDPNTGVLLPIENIRPGLYALRIENARSNGLSEGRPEAWILVSEHARYESNTAAFQECIALTEKWERNAPADAARSFCRAYLDYLASDGAR